MLLDWSPTCDTQPHTTSSTRSGSIPARSTNVLSTNADRSAACTVESPPFRLPTGVRTASTMTASRMANLHSVTTGHAEHVRPQIVQYHLLADRRDTEQAGFAEIAGHVVLLGVAHPAVGLQRAVGRREAGL